jgi:hypothetical protein
MNKVADTLALGILVGLKLSIPQGRSEEKKRKKKGEKKVHAQQAFGWCS